MRRTNTRVVRVPRGIHALWRFTEERVEAVEQVAARAALRAVLRSVRRVRLRLRRVESRRVAEVLERKPKRREQRRGRLGCRRIGRIELLRDDDAHPCRTRGSGEAVERRVQLGKPLVVHEDDVAHKQLQLRLVHNR